MFDLGRCEMPWQITPNGGKSTAARRSVGYRAIMASLSSARPGSLFYRDRRKLYNDSFEHLMFLGSPCTRFLSMTKRSSCGQKRRQNGKKYLCRIWLLFEVLNAWFYRRRVRQEFNCLMIFIGNDVIID